MWRTAETFFTGGRNRFSRIADAADPIKTTEEKSKKKCSILLFLTLCFFGFTSYLLCFQTAVIGIAPITRTTLDRTSKELQERSLHLEKTCRRLQLKPYTISTSRFYIYKPSSLFFCKVPKCGSTYWMRFFQVLSHSKREKDPFNTIRFKIHRTQMKTKFRKVDNLHLNETMRFLVTRNPYSRLYSAYVDKLFLPELWNTYGRNIVKHVRKNASKLSTLCGNDVTFSEFLQIITQRNHMHFKWLNPHWAPIEQICRPCTYKYNFIIKQETFDRDRDYLISRVGIKEEIILNYNNISNWNYSLSAIKDLCHTIFMHFRDRSPKICYKLEVLVQRLFVSFQIQGYIREDATFNLSRFGDLNREGDIEKIIETFQNIYKEHPVLTRQDWTKQRQSFMKKAYKLVDTELLQKIKKSYNLDFQIFNYDTEPDEIFQNK